MPQNAFFPWTHNLLVSQKMMQRHFFSTLHPLSPVILATATVEAFVLLHNSRFNFHCYTLHEAMPTQKLAWKWRCNLSWLLAWKITKGIHSCKIASLNRLTGLVILSAHSNIYSKVKITKLKAKCTDSKYESEKMAATLISTPSHYQVPQ